jgi:hypothetical protein
MICYRCTSIDHASYNHAALTRLTDWPDKLEVSLSMLIEGTYCTALAGILFHVVQPKYVIMDDWTTTAPSMASTSEPT